MTDAMAAVRTSTVPAAWVQFLRAQATVRRRMDARLLSEHGLTLSDYEVLLRLGHAERSMLRRVDLAEQVSLSQSGITRLLRGLEDAGYVERATCPTDARVVYAVLTDAGKRKLRAAGRTHEEDIEAFFARHFSADELEQLNDLLGRVGEGELGLACSV
jgi:DNA-binding MarR family transcriptional regulator